jgi:hypothetical protein
MTSATNVGDPDAVNQVALGDPPPRHALRADGHRAAAQHRAQ